LIRRGSRKTLLAVVDNVMSCLMVVVHTPVVAAHNYVALWRSDKYAVERVVHNSGVPLHVLGFLRRCFVPMADVLPWFVLKAPQAKVAAGQFQPQSLQHGGFASSYLAAASPPFVSGVLVLLLSHLRILVR
jgi:hypothetical protein